jgi:hypothetical protein
MPELVERLRGDQEAIGRWTGFVVFAVMIARQLTFFPGFGPFGIESARWLLVTLLFVLWAGKEASFDFRLPKMPLLVGALVLLVGAGGMEAVEVVVAKGFEGCLIFADDDWRFGEVSDRSVRLARGQDAALKRRAFESGFKEEARCSLSE